jgi:hypothetical protein
MGSHVYYSYGYPCIPIQLRCCSSPSPCTPPPNHLTRVPIGTHGERGGEVMALVCMCVLLRGVFNQHCRCACLGSVPSEHTSSTTGILNLMMRFSSAAWIRWQAWCHHACRRQRTKHASPITGRLQCVGVLRSSCLLSVCCSHHTPTHTHHHTPSHTLTHTGRCCTCTCTFTCLYTCRLEGLPCSSTVSSYMCVYVRLCREKQCEAMGCSRASGQEGHHMNINYLPSNTFA